MTNDHAALHQELTLISHLRARSAIRRGELYSTLAFNLAPAPEIEELITAAHAAEARLLVALGEALVQASDDLKAAEAAPEPEPAASDDGVRRFGGSAGRPGDAMRSLQISQAKARGEWRGNAH
jgi:hypothetical protein